MMINPFYSRASEYIELDDKFLTLFSPEILSIFNQNSFNLWKNINIIRSSPGGGKTTLLKLFTPQVLKKLRETKKHQDHDREIFSCLKNLDVYDNEENIKVIGTLLSFNTEYVSIEFLQFTESQKIRVFFSLVNIRIILSVLQSIYFLKNFTTEEDYSRIGIVKNNDSLPLSIRNISNGFDLYQWACDQEEFICKKIDSVYFDNQKIIDGTDTLYSLDLLANQNLTIDGKLLNERILIMLDDVHNLSAFQRQHLVSTIIHKRPPINIWISERLKALTMDELFSEGDTEGRDMNTIYIEKFWQKKHGSFEKFAKSVANRRIATPFETRDFASFLIEEFEESEHKRIKDVIETIKERVLAEYGTTLRYQSWISLKEMSENNLYTQAIEWKALEILLYRDKNKTQLRLAFDTELNEVDLGNQEGSDVKAAAQLFLNKEFKLPFYYGIKKICRLASFNIEQFLSIAGHFYEEIKNNKIKKVVTNGHKLEITPERQEQIVKYYVNKIKWNELINKVPNFSQIRIFMDAIGEYCAVETYTPNAWNSPGINGVAILMSDRNLLKNTALKDKNHMYHSLAKCIADCISYNLINFDLNYNCKNKTWMILYLNKVYCAKYNLPMNNGGFKEKTLKDLLSWFKNGYKAKNTNKLIL